MGDDYLYQQMYEDKLAKQDLVVVFVIFATVSMLLGIGLGRFFNRGYGDRMSGATWFALLIGCILGGAIGLYLAQITQPGMTLAGATILGLSAAQRASVSNGSTKFVFGAFWVIAGVLLLVAVHGEPPRKAGAFQLVATTGVGIGIVQIVRGVIQASRKPKSFEEELAERSEAVARRYRAERPSFGCIYCHGSIPFTADQAGKPVRCPECRLISNVPADVPLIEP